MSTARISVNIDEDVKQNAQRVLSEIGMDMTTAIDLTLRAIVREERIPFDLCTERAYREAAHRDYINSELDKSMSEANDPNVRRLTHDEVMANLDRQRAARNRV